MIIPLGEVSPNLIFVNARQPSRSACPRFAVDETLHMNSEIS